MRRLSIIRSWPSLCIVIAALWTAPLSARELHAPIDDMIAVELLTVGVNTLTGAPVVVLREPESGDTIPVVIGSPEAQAILMALHEIQVPRPMTHDLISGILSASGMRLERVLIDALVEGTYHGALELRSANGDGNGDAPVYVDARPSDSLAIAVREKAAIFMAPTVLEAARQLDMEDGDGLGVTALGMSVIAVTRALRESLGLDDRNGVLVSRSAGAAAAAGVPPGALILSVNGRTPASPEEFLTLVEDTPPDSDVQIVYWLDGVEREVALPQGPGDAGTVRQTQPKLRV